MNQLMTNEAIEHFGLEGIVTEICPYGSGHINDTFLLTLDLPSGEKGKVILQHMNKVVFTKPVELMENVLAVTAYLKKRIAEKGGDEERETLTVIQTKEKLPFYLDSEGEYWRCYRFIDGACSYDEARSPKEFYESAVAFGQFQSLLSEYPIGNLHETIEGFHDTAARYQVFLQAVKEDRCNRADTATEEITFVLNHEKLATVLGDLVQKGEIPLRVTHNDTKLNNVMFDQASGKAICVVDLDTVMPGLAVHDFGDAVRYGANTGAEDDRDLSRVSLNMDMFEAFTKGFIEGCQGRLTEKELEMLPMGALVITYELGMRFLTDYLGGDTYFKIHRENHNLERARAQFALLADMEEKMDQMAAVVEKYRNKQ